MPKRSYLPIAFLTFIVAITSAHGQLPAGPTEGDTDITAYTSDEGGAGGVPFHRRIMRDDITIRIKNLRLDSGERIRLVLGLPKSDKKVPAVFILDTETIALSSAPRRAVPGYSNKQIRDLKDSSYLMRSPFGSNLLGNGFAVAYVTADSLDTVRSARTPDWVGIFNRLRDLKQSDENNVFLFSTREYANLSVYLSSKYNFTGLVLEEPSYLLFSKNTYENVIESCDRLTPEEIWSKTDPTREFVYETVLGRISTPIMLIRNPQSTAYHFTEKTLIPKLNQVNAIYETVEIPGPGRALTVFGGAGVMDVSPKISYHTGNVSKWVDEIITYMKFHSTVDPVALRDPSNYRNW